MDFAGYHSKVQIGHQARGGVLIGVLYDRINGRVPDHTQLL